MPPRRKAASKCATARKLLRSRCATAPSSLRPCSLDGAPQRIGANALVVAAGGFEANLDWLREAWGDAARNFVVRGTPYNTGTMLRALLDAGAAPVGDARECHAVAVDGRAPKFDGGIVTRLDCIPLGIVVDRSAERFYDEGEDVWPKRYAIWGKLVARRPGEIAYSIVDAKVRGLFMPSVYPAIEAASIEALAAQLALPPKRLEATIATFNRAVQPGTFRPHDARRLPHRRACAREDALGAAPRHAAVLPPIRCVPASHSPT